MPLNSPQRRKKSIGAAGSADAAPLALVTPMAEEAVALRQAMTGVRRRAVAAGVSADEGRLAGVPLLLVECGVGKVAAAASTQAVLQAAPCGGVLVLGIAGGIAPHVHLGDVIVATETLQHDLDARPFFPRSHVPHLGRATFEADPALHSRAVIVARRLAKGLAGARPGNLAATPPQVQEAPILTGDQVIGTRRRREALWRAFPEALAVDMETAAVAQVCHQNGVPWTAVRVVSDGMEDRIDPRQVLDYAATVATVFLRDVVVGMLEHQHPVRQPAAHQQQAAG